MDKECSICTEPFTKVKRKPVECPRCNKHSCVECLKQYIINNPLNEPHCMFCHQGFTFDFLTAELTKTFIHKDLRGIREEQLLTRELALMPSTQEAAEQKHKTEKIEANIKEIVKQKRDIYRQVSELRYKADELDRKVRYMRHKIRLVNDPRYYYYEEEELVRVLRRRVRRRY